MIYLTNTILLILNFTISLLNNNNRFCYFESNIFIYQNKILSLGVNILLCIIELKQIFFYFNIQPK